MSSSLSIIAGGAVGPKEIGAAAQAAEANGFTRLWLAEDYFLTGGIAGAAIALAATERLRVGTGVLSAVTRHPALLAMEVSTLATAYPGRFTLGIGFGLPLWMSQMGIDPESPLGATRAAVQATRRLLAGEKLTVEDGNAVARNVELGYPAPEVPIYLGAMGPRMLALSGAIADGTILSILACPSYVRAARSAIGGNPEHRVTAFAVFNVDRNSKAARDGVRSRVAFSLKRGRSPLTDAAGISDELDQFLRERGPRLLEAEMPERWIERITVSGTPDQCIAAIEQLLASGADDVALFPIPGSDAPRLVEAAGQLVLPGLK